MKGNLNKIIELMKYSGEDVNSLSEQGYDFLEILTAANWLHFSEDVTTESIRHFSHEEMQEIPENIRKRIIDIIYKEGISPIKKENFIDLISGFSEFKSEIDEDEFENIIDVIFEDRVV
ncbi:MAG: hypothetical protein M0R46_01770 [Candidatus Muirbacterium halophilum]|nr:hypothetical protein [Candidatus Muirbacterium halophilum]MCK9474623.1 hypothetical protein [Candidatus Muirbacterium halophilum]